MVPDIYYLAHNPWSLQGSVHTWYAHSLHQAKSRWLQGRPPYVPDFKSVTSDDPEEAWSFTNTSVFKHVSWNKAFLHFVLSFSLGFSKWRSWNPLLIEIRSTWKIWGQNGELRVKRRIFPNPQGQENQFCCCFWLLFLVFFSLHNTKLMSHYKEEVANSYKQYCYSLSFVKK